MKFTEMILHLPDKAMCRALQNNGFHIEITGEGIVAEYDGDNIYVGDYVLSEEDIEAEDWEFYENIINNLFQRASMLCIHAADHEAYSDFIDLEKTYNNLHWFINKWEDYKDENC